MLEEVCASKGMDYAAFAKGLKEKVLTLQLSVHSLLPSAKSAALSAFGHAWWRCALRVEF